MKHLFDYECLCVDCIYTDKQIKNNIWSEEFKRIYLKHKLLSNKTDHKNIEYNS